MAENREIIHLDDIKQLVDTFYTRVRADELLGPVFEGRIQDNWARHLDIMYRFWQTVLLGELTYQGSPGFKHITLPVGEEHFERWLQIFYQTIDELFTGEKAVEAKWRAERMAEMFHSKIEYYKQNKSRSIL
ncbi:group III truncated hemoglobin [Pontibacter cellulosilyticus]|uniref:Group III truncated hemoglobin n=1 Tax=Pontibacter cellulosilyticus TaxID=1720253 RepID=A0A923N9Y3_9BACT|nr:group III truncated hemoglobin [Pontibacter cellulosilyticus]MBC5994512.1 group III truncated hemoglobin [Pontibacter cellulosilyticus]